jgi:hypothetical protein
MSGIIKSLSELSTAGRPSRPSGAKNDLEGRPADANRGVTPGSPVGCKNKIPWVVLSIVLAAPRSIFACAACTGRSDDAVAQGLNAAVLMLLLVLLVVLGAFVSFLAYLVRRAAKHPLPLPDVQEGAV